MNGEIISSLADVLLKSHTKSRFTVAEDPAPMDIGASLPMRGSPPVADRCYKG